MITYAQNFEDVMLARLFAGQESGFYVDIGAAHPSFLSVTRHFYDQGWRGVNVEPIPRNWELFLRDRPRDRNLNVAVGTRPGKREFCEVVGNDALSSLDEGRIAKLRATAAQVDLYEVECVTGDSILDECPAEVDFVKIDVEGAEEDVLRSIDLSRHRPKVFVIEATAPCDSFPGWERFSPASLARWDRWEPYLVGHGYRFAHDDGLNRFYLREDLGGLADRLAVPPGVFDFIVPDLLESANRRWSESEAAFRAALRERDETIRCLWAGWVGPAPVAAVAPGRPEGEGGVPRVTRRWPREALEPSRLVESMLPLLLQPMVDFLLRHRRNVDRLVDRVYSRLNPKLGVLLQHAPVPARLPAPRTRAARGESGPSFCIVSPSFRQAPFVERTIRSVLDQGYSGVSYFIQDGGSDDGTLEVVRKYEDRLAGWDSRPDSGQAEAVNRGFARVGGDIMSWLNTDDVLLPGSLAYVAGYFASHPEVDVVYGNRILIDEDDREIGRWILPPHEDGVLSWADFVPQETLFWRRRAWEMAGGRLDESFQFALDWDLLIRFRDAGARFARLPRFLGGFRVHARQKTSALISELGAREMDRIRERTLGRVPRADEFQAEVGPYLQRHVADELAWRIRRRMGWPP